MQWHARERAEYSQDLNDARLETVATFMDEDPDFRLMFSPQTLASLADASAEYRAELRAFEHAQEMLRDLCLAQSSTPELRVVWGNMAQLLNETLRGTHDERYASDTGFPLSNSYRAKYSTLHVRGEVRAPVQDVEICDTQVPRRCYVMHLDPPRPGQALRGPADTMAFYARMFGSLPPVTLHFQQPAMRVGRARTFAEIAQSGEISSEDMRAALFQLTYTLAGMYAVLKLRFNCLQQLTNTVLFATKSSFSGIYTVVEKHHVRQDWEVPASSAFLLIKPNYSQMSSAMVFSDPLLKNNIPMRVNPVEESASDLKQFLWQLLRDPAKSGMHLRPLSGGMMVAYQLAIECFGGSFATDFSSRIPEPARDMTIYEALESSLFTDFRRSQASERTPTCVWEMPTHPSRNSSTN
jgi:hypothetical protein